MNNAVQAAPVTKWVSITSVHFYLCCSSRVCVCVCLCMYRLYGFITSVFLDARRISVQASGGPPPFLLSLLGPGCRRPRPLFFPSPRSKLQEAPPPFLLSLLVAGFRRPRPLSFPSLVQDAGGHTLFYFPPSCPARRRPRPLFFPSSVLLHLLLPFIPPGDKQTQRDRYAKRRLRSGTRKTKRYLSLIYFKICLLGRNK